MARAAIVLSVLLSVFICYIDAEYTCTAVGRFSDASDATCKSFYICSKKSNGEYIKASSSCSSDKSFDPDLGRCSSDYKCEATTTTTTTTTTELPTTTIAPEFTCTERGRFNNPADKFCQSYYLCSKLGSSFIQTLYKCPLSSVFDPDLHKCSTEYVCPYVTTLSPSTTTTLPETTTYDDLTTEPEATTIFELSSTTTEDSVTVPYPSETDFTCSALGRFANFNDGRCKWYFLCNELRNGSFIQTPYFCPKDSVFDPSIHKCSILYDCPVVVNLEDSGTYL